ncbi:alpha/beta fold hydrolase [Rhodococcus ruber]|uniref:alpha/beta fold hydrolase n=1 Tax=Rhodococcus ruber TaxID=1830 RepID=UPI000E6B4484|nr:alpha/beta fold hydrolase [Rhodococcus ruber]AXY49211.1 alpha/beta hydrolase fold protein [Rhodococcus ruber]
MRTHEQRSLNQVQRPEAYREVLIASAGGTVALSVWQAQPDAPAMVFLPGTMTHPLLYEEFLDALNRSDLTVVGLHPAAHGKSPRLARRLTFETLVVNALDAVAWTQKEYPSAPISVLGSSQGGVLALAVAARATGVARVFAHNVLDPALPSSLGVTRAPTWLAPAYPQLRRMTAVLGKVLPGLPVPFDLYLDMDRVARDPEVAELFYTDPLGLRRYPLSLLAGMLAGELPGPAQCPVTVLAASGDPLFSLDYTREVYERIAAPSKELVVLASDRHLIFIEDLDTTLDALLPLLHGSAGGLPTATTRESADTSWPHALGHRQQR